MRAAQPLLIETHGKQQYLFGTGRRRESVGASHLVQQLAETWAPEAVAAVTGRPPGTLVGGAGVELLVATSGTVLGFAGDADAARRVVTEVTVRALRDAPGLHVTGVVGDPVDWDAGTGPRAPDAVRQVFDLMAVQRVAQPAPSARFPVLPVTALCPSSGLPAAGYRRVGDDAATTAPRSAASLATFDAARAAYDRLGRVTGLGADAVALAVRALDGSEEGSPDRVALVHADGNGLGGVFRDLHELVTLDAHAPDSSYAAAYRGFSRALDTAAERAFRAAVEAVAVEGADPPLVLPLVLAGDDLTVAADAAVAAALTRAYLTGFVRAVSADPLAAGVLARRRAVPGDPRLGMAAGLVVTTPSFPFTSAYQLAEQLVTEVAKQAKHRFTDERGHPVPCISTALHVQLDTTATTLDDLVDGLTVRRPDAVDPTHVLTASPYVETVGTGAEPSESARDWARGRDADGLWQLAARVGATGHDGRRVLPSAQLHELRARLRPRPDAADELLRRLTAAPGGAPWRDLEEDSGSLFTRRAAEPATTRLLDALSLAPYLPVPGAVARA